MTDRLDVKSKLSANPSFLWVGTSEPTWTSLALSLDGIGHHSSRFFWATSTSTAFSHLRDEPVDCVIVCPFQIASGGTGMGRNESIYDSDITLARFLPALRAGGFEGAVVVVTPHASHSDWQTALCYECEILVTAELWNSPVLLDMVLHAVSRMGLRQEHHRLSLAEHKRLTRERDEADHLLSQQRAIVAQLESLSATGNASPPTDTETPTSRLTSTLQQMQEILSDSSTEPATSAQLPEGINAYYQELLRTYVIMGSGSSLGEEIATLAELIAAANLTPRETLQLHLARVESIVNGLGNRSFRHVMARADLLILELMMRLGECYRRRLDRQAGIPPPHPESLQPASLDWENQLSTSVQPIPGTQQRRDII